VSFDGMQPNSRQQPGGLALVVATAIALGLLPHSGLAQAVKRVGAAGLEGSWSGGGTVTFTSGVREQARCRARYNRAGNNSYNVNAVCATASGRAAQTATVRQVGENRYSGSFFNSEYSVSGTMYIVVRGASQTVRLISSSGSGILTLSR
jgi:hypothetical protein